MQCPACRGRLALKQDCLVCSKGPGMGGRGKVLPQNPPEDGDVVTLTYGPLATSRRVQPLPPLPPRTTT